MATLYYSDATLNTWEEKFSKLVKAYEKSDCITPHFGTANEKTHAVNEGTLPLVTCAMCAKDEGGCAHSCYAIRTCFYSLEAREHYAANTVIRRRDAKRYYDMAFAAAFSAGALLRLNESGDFENAAQFKAMCASAKKYPTVKAIAYTHRIEIAARLKLAPKNVSFRYSVWTDCDNQSWAKKNRIPFAAVAKEPQTVKNAVYCPSQARKELNNERTAEGLDPLPEWSCAACAAAGIGCASKKNVVFKMH